MYYTNIQSQIEELETLQSIYMEDMIMNSELPDPNDYKEPFQFKLTVPVEIQSEPIFVKLAPKSKEEKQEEIIPIQNSFPPCVLSITFPPTYPDTDPPDIKIQGSWITENIQNQILYQLNDVMALESGYPVIFSVYNWIQYDCINALCKENEKNEKSITLFYETLSKNKTQNLFSNSMEEIVDSLLNHTKQQNRNKFSKRSAYL